MLLCFLTICGMNVLHLTSAVPTSPPGGVPLAVNINQYCEMGCSTAGGPQDVVCSCTPIMFGQNSSRLNPGPTLITTSRTLNVEWVEDLADFSTPLYRLAQVQLRSKLKTCKSIPCRIVFSNNKGRLKVIIKAWYDLLSGSSKVVTSKTCPPPTRRSSCCPSPSPSRSCSSSPAAARSIVCPATLPTPVPAPRICGFADAPGTCISPLSDLSADTRSAQSTVNKYLPFKANHPPLGNPSTGSTVTGDTAVDAASSNSPSLAGDNSIKSYAQNADVNVHPNSVVKDYNSSHTRRTIFIGNADCPEFGNHLKQCIPLKYDARIIQRLNVSNESRYMYGGTKCNSSTEQYGTREDREETNRSDDDQESHNSSDIYGLSRPNNKSADEKASLLIEEYKSAELQELRKLRVPQVKTPPKKPTTPPKTDVKSTNIFKILFGTDYGVIFLTVLLYGCRKGIQCLGPWGLHSTSVKKDALREGMLKHTKGQRKQKPH